MPHAGSAHQAYGCAKMAAFWVAVIKGRKNGRKMAKPGQVRLERSQGCETSVSGLIVPPGLPGTPGPHS